MGDDNNDMDLLKSLEEQTANDKYYLSEDAKASIKSIQDVVNKKIKALDVRGKFNPSIRKIINIINTDAPCADIFNKLILDPNFSNTYTSKSLNVTEFKTRIDSINTLVDCLYKYVSNTIGFNKNEFSIFIQTLNNLDVSNINDDDDRLKNFVDIYDKAISNLSNNIFVLSIYGVLYTKIVSVITKINPYVQAIKFNLITRKKLKSRGYKYLSNNYKFKFGKIHDEYVPYKKTKVAKQEKEYERYASIMLPVNCLDECIIEAKDFSSYYMQRGIEEWFTILLKMSDYFGGSINSWLSLFVPVIIKTSSVQITNPATGQSQLVPQIYCYKCKYIPSPDGTVEIVRTNTIYDIKNLDDEVVKQLRYYNTRTNSIQMLENADTPLNRLTKTTPTISLEERAARLNAAKGLTKRNVSTSLSIDNETEY